MFHDQLRTPFAQKLVRILILAVALRVFVIICAAGVPTMAIADSDTDRYVNAALKLNEQGIFEDYYIGPTYPALLAGIMKATAWTDLPLRVSVGLVQAGLSIGTLVLAALLARKRLGSDRAGIVTAIWLAIWPNAWLSTASFMTERLATPSFMLGVFCLLYYQRPSKRWLAVSGLAFALAILTRPALLPVLPIAVGIALWSPAKQRMAWRNAAVVLASSLALIGPWVLYAWHDTGYLIPVGSGGGFNLCMGNNDDANGGWSEAAAQNTCRRPLISNEPRDDGTYRSTAIEWITSHPEQQPGLILKRFSVLMADDNDALGLYPDYKNWKMPLPMMPLEVLTWWWWLIFVVTSVLGWWRLKRNQPKFRRYINWLIVGVAFIPLISVAAERYHEPIVPLMAICAACFKLRPNGKLVAFIQSVKFRLSGKIQQR